MDCDLIKIKEKYGEKMMHLCRELFPTLLDNEGLLYDIISSHFAPNRYLYDDIINNSLINEFKNYIYSFVLIKPSEEEIQKTPYELMDIVGYDLYECKSEEDIKVFSKYYEATEKLCTFKGGRLDSCYVFFAVKKDVDKIIRSDFIEPQRQDQYGTSVISIQFTKGTVNTLSIKNRYNHKVNNPDATFANCLDNIIPGLTKSFEKTFDLNIRQSSSSSFEMPGYVMANNGKLYKYNYEINNKYYCPNNIIIDNFKVVNDYREKEKYLIIDYFIFDLVNKRIYLYDDSIEDPFIDGLKGIKKIEITKNKYIKSKILNIIFEDNSNAIIEIDKLNRIISYTNNNITSIMNKFLFKNKTIEKLELKKVKKVGDRFLCCNRILKEIYVDSLEEIGDFFLSSNLGISEINLPNVLHIGDDFMRINKKLVAFIAPNLKMVGNNFFRENTELKILKVDNLVYVADYFLVSNLKLEILECPNLKMVGDHFLDNNYFIKEIVLDKLKYVGNYFLNNIQHPTSITLNNLEKTRDFFLCNSKGLKSFNATNLKCVGNHFIANNVNLETINTPNLVIVGDSFLYKNNSLTSLTLPHLITAAGDFLYYNECLKKLYAPNLMTIGSCFLFNNTQLENYDLSSLKNIGLNFCFKLKKMKRKVLKLVKYNPKW